MKKSFITLRPDYKVGVTTHTNTTHDFGIYCIYGITQKPPGAQWLSGRVLDSRQSGHRFEPYRHHCVVSLSKTHLSLFNLIQPRKTGTDITETLLTRT